MQSPNSEMMQSANNNLDSQSKNAIAGFGTRWVAYIIDCLLIGLVSNIVGLPIMIASLFSEESIWTTRVLFDFTLYAVVMYCIRAVYLVICTYSFGKTPGKAILRIEVQSKDGEKLTFVNVLFRETIGRFLSGFFLNVGYLYALAGKEHLTFHDMLCDTRVCYTDLAEMEKKIPVNMQQSQPLPHIVPVNPIEQPMPASEVQENVEQVFTMPQQTDVVETTEQEKDNSVFSVPEQEETIVPEQEETTVPEQEETTVPEQEETTMPEQEETTVLEPEETISENEEQV